MNRAQVVPIHPNMSAILLLRDWSDVFCQFGLERMDGLENLRPQSKQEREVQLGRWATAYDNGEDDEDDEESEGGYMPDVEDMYDSEQDNLTKNGQERSRTDNEQDIDTDEEDAAYYMLADDEDEDATTVWSESSAEMRREEDSERTDEDNAAVEAMLLTIADGPLHSKSG